MNAFFLSIDVGTGSLRAALVTVYGGISAIETAPVIIWKSPGKMEQSSDNIWQTCTHVVRQLISKNKINPKQILGIGIDTTASLVLLDSSFKPLPLPGNNKANILGWMDHRAAMQAETLTGQYPHLLKGMGARLIPETSIARLFWLKQEAPGLWRKTGCILDLYDFMVWKCTGVISRSSTAISHLDTNKALLNLELDSEDRLKGENYATGSAVGKGLNQQAASELGLQQGTPVASGIVDGLGGTLSTILSQPANNCAPAISLETITSRISMTVGSSAVFAASSKQAIESPYFWGPWPSMFEGFYKYIIRQTAAGVLIDHIIQSHPAYLAAQNTSISMGISVYQYLHHILKHLANSNPVELLSEHIHIQPDFAGNHCPRMDFSLRGMISGLSLDSSEQSLALIYLATLQALALGAKHNIYLLTEMGINAEILMACGGLSKNDLYMQLHVDAMGIPAALPQEPDAMLLSGAIIAAVATGVYPNLEETMKSMTRYRKVIEPNNEIQVYLNKKYEVFQEMYKDQMKYRSIMKRK